MIILHSKVSSIVSRNLITSSGHLRFFFFFFFFFGYLHFQRILPGFKIIQLENMSTIIYKHKKAEKHHHKWLYWFPSIFIISSLTRIKWNKIKEVTFSVKCRLHCVSHFPIKKCYPSPIRFHNAPYWDLFFQLCMNTLHLSI